MRWTRSRSAQAQRPAWARAHWEQGLCRHNPDWCARGEGHAGECGISLSEADLAAKADEKNESRRETRAAEARAKMAQETKARVARLRAMGIEDTKDKMALVEALRAHTRIESVGVMNVAIDLISEGSKQLRQKMGRSVYEKVAKTTESEVDLLNQIMHVNASCDADRAFQFKENSHLHGAALAHAAQTES